MAQTISISTGELQRVAESAYIGQTIEVMLCGGLPGYSVEDTVADWQLAEVSGSGYLRYSTTILAGSYDLTSASYLIPDIQASFSASGGTISYDTVVIYIQGSTYVHSIITENPGIVLQSGQTQTYVISLSTDD